MATLGALRLQAQQRSDMENSPAVTAQEWNNYISLSYAELFDILVGAYGNEYFAAPPFQFILTGSQFYDLPLDFYKLTGVDLQYSGSPSGWVTLRRFEFIERNKYAYPNTATNFLGYTNLRYRLMGDSLELIPIPMSGQIVRVWYIPRPIPLQFMPSSSIVINTPFVTLLPSDFSNIQVGMNVAGPSIQTNTVVTAVDPLLNEVTLSKNAMATNPTATLSFWNDSVTIDGIAGWEEYLIIDAAIKALIKQEQDIQPLLIQKGAIKARIESMAEGRDAGQAHHVSDVLSISGFGMDGIGSPYGWESSW